MKFVYTITIDTSKTPSSNDAEGQADDIQRAFDVASRCQYQHIEPITGEREYPNKWLTIDGGVSYEI